MVCADGRAWSGSVGATPLLVLPIFIGLEASGTLRALYNLAMPALQVFSALSVMALPDVRPRPGPGELGRTVRGVGTAFAVLSVAYGSLILLGGRWAVDWLYAGQYAVSLPVLLLLALAPVGAACANVLVAIVRSAEQPRLVFKARSVTVGVTATVGLVATAALGVVGALLSDVIALLTEIAVLVRPARLAVATPSPPSQAETPSRPASVAEPVIAT